MAASRYRKYLLLIEKWPIDNSRGNRDLGALLRKRILTGFSQGEATAVNDVECDKIYESLHRITTDCYKGLYERSTTTNASGAGAEVLKEVLSDAGLEEFGSKSVLARLKEKLVTRK